MSIRVRVFFYLCACTLPAAFCWYIAFAWIDFAHTYSADLWFGLCVVSCFAYILAVAGIYYFPIRPSHPSRRWAAAFGFGVVTLVVWSLGVYAGARVFDL